MLNRCAARTLIARETAELLVDHDPPALVSRIGQQVGFAEAARGGRLIGEVDENGPAAREIVALAARSRGSRYKRARFQARLRRPPERRRSLGAQPGVPAVARCARLTIDVTPGQRGGIKVAAFRRGLTVADMLRALLAREFPEHEGGA